MSIDSSQSFHKENLIRNNSPESDSGLNSHPTGDDNSSVRSDIFDQNVMATSTPHRVDGSLQPPDILLNKETQRNDDILPSLNYSNDSSKENIDHSMYNENSTDDNVSSTNGMFRDRTEALTEQLLNNISNPNSQARKIDNLEQEIERLRKENNQLQIDYKEKVIKISEQEQDLNCLRNRIANLNDITEDQKNINSEKEAIMEMVNDKDRIISELKGELKNTNAELEKQNASYQIEKNQFVNLQKKYENLMSELKGKKNYEFTIGNLEKENLDLKMKLEYSKDRNERNEMTIKNMSKELEKVKNKNRELNDEVEKLSRRPKVVNKRLQTDNFPISDSPIDSGGNVSCMKGNDTRDILFAGLRTPIHNGDISNTMFTTPGIGDQTMWNKISDEAKEMLTTSEKLKKVVDVLKEQRIYEINDKVKHKIIEETIQIIDNEFLKQLKKIVQPLQTFQVLAKAQKQDIVALQKEKEELVHTIEKSQTSMTIIAKEYNINCKGIDGQLNIQEFWNNLSLYLSNLKKVIITDINKDTGTLHNDSVQLSKTLSNPHLSKRSAINFRDGHISPILNNTRKDITNKQEDALIIQELFKEYNASKEQFIHFKEELRRVIDEKNRLVNLLEKKSDEYKSKEGTYEQSISELKEIVCKKENELLELQKRVKKAKRIIIQLGSTFQSHFDLHHKDIKINENAYDCFSVLKHVSEFTKDRNT